ncbi:MAG: hypothetical protein ABI867_44110 [Kofleriaceae bacterium]
MRAILQLTVVALAACGNEPIVEEPPRPPEVSVGLASTRLGSDCRAAVEHETKGPTQRIPCEQTAVQLSIRSPASAALQAPTTIQMKRVELLDRNGTLIEVLTAHSPSRWKTDQFVAWDERVAPGQTMAVGYKLSSPDWSKIPNANQRSFKLRVTVTVGERERTFEATAELRIEDTNNIVT